jgi:type II secretory pathway component PulM
MDGTRASVLDAATLASALAPLLAEHLAARTARVTRSIAEACGAIGCSWALWREYVEPEVRVVRRGRRKLVPVAELTAWVDRNAELTFPATGKQAAPTAPAPAKRGVRARRAPTRRAA